MKKIFIQNSITIKRLYITVFKVIAIYIARKRSTYDNDKTTSNIKHRLDLYAKLYVTRVNLLNIAQGIQHK